MTDIQEATSASPGPASTSPPATPTGGTTPTAPSTAGRRKALWIAVTAAVGVLLLGYLATVFVRSPAQRAAETAPPPPSLVTATVESKVLADAVVVRATVQAQGTVNAVPSGVPAGAARAVISKLPVAPGGALQAGQVAVEVSGRPVVVLQGSVPAYRDLKEGAVGQDVTQLQDALGQIGHPSTPDPHGTFGAGTGKAVEAMYQAVGYPLPPGGPHVPISEVIFVNRVPVTVFSQTANVGADAAQAKVLLSDGPLVAVAPVTSASRTVLRDGLKARITAELLNKTVNGTVSLTTRAGASPDSTTTGTSSGNPSSGGDTSASTATTSSMVITPAEALGPEWSGQDVRVDVQSAATSAAVLAVPSTAVSMGADGKTAVVKVTGEGSTAQQQRLLVEVGATGGGFVEIRASDAQIKTGDKVLVGIQ